MAGRAELKNIAREWISLWSTPVNWVAFDRLHADDFEDCSPGGRGRTKDDFAGGLAELVWAFPDFKTSVDDLVVDQTGGKVAVRWSGVGTNRDTYLGIGPLTSSGTRAPSHRASGRRTGIQIPLWPTYARMYGGTPRFGARPGPGVAPGAPGPRSPSRSGTRRRAARS
jgi:hypothetical protein